jgi:hypothetical protein
MIKFFAAQFVAHDIEVAAKKDIVAKEGISPICWLSSVQGGDNSFGSRFATENDYRLCPSLSEQYRGANRAAEPC